MCGCEGTGGPSWRTSTPSSYAAPESSSAETNWLEAEASITTVPPRTRPVPDTVKGRVPRSPSSTRTPRVRRASRTADIGRVRACGSPSKATSPLARAATGGTNRITVPARPQSTVPPRSRLGKTSQSSSDVITVDPSVDSAVAISSVSRERRARRTTEGPSDSAASTSARLVSDLEPGSSTRTSTGARANGAGHRADDVSGRVSTPPRLTNYGARDFAASLASSLASRLRCLA